LIFFLGFLHCEFGRGTKHDGHRAGWKGDAKHENWDRAIKYWPEGETWGEPNRRAARGTIGDKQTNVTTLKKKHTRQIRDPCREAVAYSALKNKGGECLERCRTRSGEKTTLFAREQFPSWADPGKKQTQILPCLSILLQSTPCRAAWPSCSNPPRPTSRSLIAPFTVGNEPVPQTIENKASPWGS